VPQRNAQRIDFVAALRAVFFAFVFLPVLIILGGDKPAMADRLIPEDQIIASVLVTAGPSTGSGFYLMTEKGMTFVTAKHVLYNPSGALLSETAQLLSYSLKRDSAGTLITLDLKTLAAAKLMRSHPSRDIVVIDIATTDTPELKERQFKAVLGVVMNRVSPEGVYGPSIASVKKFDDVDIGNEVFLTGFPSSIGLKNIPQIDRLKPLLRRGIVAGRNESLKTIILDCPVFPGNSGGPVIQVDRNIVEAKFSLIGVVTEFVPFDNSMWIPGHPTVLNSGLSVVVPIDVVLELIN
jgi:S1-C subfamily serine protease